MLREKETVLNKKGEEEEKPLFFGDFETPVTRWLSVAEHRRVEFNVEWKGGEKRGESSRLSTPSSERKGKMQLQKDEEKK